MAFKITEIWAFCAVGPDGDEGLPAFNAPGGLVMPMVCADKARLENLRPLAEALADKKGITIRLKRFTTMTVEEVIEPCSPKPN